MKDTNYYRSLLVRYKAGKATGAESQELFNWLTDAANEETVEDDLNRYFEHGQSFNPDDKIGERIWKQIHQQEILLSTTTTSEKTRQSKGRSMFFTWQRIAAVLVPLFIVLSVWLINNQENTTEIQVGTEMKWVTKTTSKGQRLRLTLTDGTSVQLNANTVVRVPENINNNEVREIFLESGEAFFDVAKVGTPFKVYTADQEVSVIGTSFTVSKDKSNNTENSRVRVAVLTGKVRVGQRNQAGETLVRGDAIESIGNEVKKSKIEDLDQEFAWKDGVLMYSDASFDEVIASLEQWYGVRIIKPKNFKPKQNKFQGRYKNESLKVVLEGFAHVSGCDYKIDGDIIYLTKKSV